MKLQVNSQWQIFDGYGRRKYPNEGERSRFLAAADRSEPKIRTLAYLLIFAGCRVSEALALTPEHLDAATSTVTFRTLKRRKLCFRTVPIPPELLAAIADVTNSGRIWPIHRVTAWRQIKSLFIEARVDGPMACCRGLRHSFGINAASNYVPPNLIQRWMGHAWPSTTAIYLDATGPEEQGFAERMWRGRNLTGRVSPSQSDPRGD